MSLELIARSPDLKKLQDEGFDLEIRSNHLLVHDVPYVNSRREVCRGVLVSVLTLGGERTTVPDSHVAYWVGEHPCSKDGVELSAIRHSSATMQLAPELVVHHSFSNRPPNGYPDYYCKMTRYVEVVSHPAKALDPNVTAQTFPVIKEVNDDSVFRYRDTASSRAGIGAINTKLELKRVVIIGLGGTGSYVLDLVAKTPVKQIDLYDADVYSQHNAFRSPGAPTLEQLGEKPSKVAYLQKLYSQMRKNIVAHEYAIDSTSIDELKGADFVFICADAGAFKKELFEKLDAFGIPFVDVGMGVYQVENQLAGSLRVTTSTPRKRDHVLKRVSFLQADEFDEYARNIQIADLNALNASLAVIKWKKLFGFYADLDYEHHSTYTLNGNMLINEDIG